MYGVCGVEQVAVVVLRRWVGIWHAPPGTRKDDFHDFKLICFFRADEGVGGRGGLKREPTTSIKSLDGAIITDASVDISDSVITVVFLAVGA